MITYLVWKQTISLIHFIWESVDFEANTDSVNFIVCTVMN